MAKKARTSPRRFIFAVVFLLIVAIGGVLLIGGPYITGKLILPTNGALEAPVKDDAQVDAAPVGGEALLPDAGANDEVVAPGESPIVGIPMQGSDVQGATTLAGPWAPPCLPNCQIVTIELVEPPSVSTYDYSSISAFGSPEEAAAFEAGELIEPAVYIKEGLILAVIPVESGFALEGRLVWDPETFTGLRPYGAYGGHEIDGDYYFIPGQYAVVVP